MNSQITKIIDKNIITSLWEKPDDRIRYVFQ